MAMKVNKEEKLRQINCLRGLFALEIVVGHVGRYEAGALYWLGKFMVCSVAVFFFVSSYGMVLSQKKKKEYLKGTFLMKKPFYLFILAICIYLFNSLIDLILGAKAGYASNFLSLKMAFQNTNWYIWELIFFYFLFWISYRFFYKYRIIIIAIVTTLGVTGLYYLGAKEGWFASSFGFVMGIVYGEFDGFLAYNYSVKGVLAIIGFSIFGLGSLLVKNETFLSMVWMRNSICIAAIMITVLISDFGFLRNNPVTKFLTRYSTEIYLSQFIWLKYMYEFSSNLGIRLVIVVGLTFASALLVIHPCVVGAKKMIEIMCKRMEKT